MSRLLLPSLSLLLVCASTARAQTAPAQTAPAENVPVQNAPAENVPAQSVAARSVPTQESRRITVPVFEFAAAQGSWNKLESTVSSGRIYDFAVSMNNYETSPYTKESRVVFANPGTFDLLECWVGLAQRQHNGETRFMIVGDGVLLYRSSWMNWRNQAERVSVSVKGYKGISLVTEGSRMNKFDMAIWGEPVLVQLNPPALSEDSVQFPGLMTVRQFRDGSLGISVGNADVAFGKTKPVNEGGRLLVPMRPLFEALGARITYNSTSRQITATRGDQVVALVAGTQTAFINGRSIELDDAPRIVAGETLVPLRFVAEALGVAVEYKR